MILPRAYAVKVYRDKFKPSQKGEIGITENGNWAMPYDGSPQNVTVHTSIFLSFANKLVCFLTQDVEAAQHALDVAIGKMDRSGLQFC